MANILELENLSGNLQIGPNGEFGSSARNENRARQEMEKNGMEIPGASIESPGNAQPANFGDILKDNFEKVNTFQHQADEAIKNLVSGRSKNIHETMLAVERADTSLKMMMQVRNKILDAYREIMRMQV